MTKNRLERTRLSLHEELVKLLGSNNVYFQPPTNTQIKYPAIIYSTEGINNKFADGRVYVQHTSYAVTVISTDPTNDIIDSLSRDFNSRFVRRYNANGFSHYVFNISYTLPKK